METARTLANVAGRYLLNAQAREQARDSSARMLHLAMHDALTGLPNGCCLQERIEHASAEPSGPVRTRRSCSST